MATEPRQTEMLWPDLRKGPWRLQVWWRVQHGVPTPVGLALTSWIDELDDRPGLHNGLPLAYEDVELPAVTGQLLRGLPLGALLDDLRETQRAMLTEDRDQTGWLPEWRESWARWREETAAEREAFDGAKRGNRDLGDDHYRETAEVYARAVQEGRSPTRAVAEHFTIEKSSAAKKVARARERGFLPKTSRGRVGPLTKEL